jgi:hypothetical protein
VDSTLTPDWIEFYNTGKEDVDLAGYYLTDDSTNLKKFAFTTDAVVKAGGTLVVWAAGSSNTGRGALHAGFKLSATKDNLVTLSDPNGSTVDTVAFGASLAQNASYARLPDGTGDFAWCTMATPNAVNGKACK